MTCNNDMKKISVILIQAALLVLIPACATLPESGQLIQHTGDNVKPAMTGVKEGNSKNDAAVNNEGEGWHHVGFRMAWSEEEEASWFVDVYLGHRILKPVLEQYRHKIKLWRFHRRAARDATGHQFSLLFYANSGVAEEVFDIIRNNQQLMVVSNSGVVNSIKYSDTVNIARPRIRDSSDKGWSEAVQKTWPWFIMGVSEMWLRMIDELAGEEMAGTDSEDYQTMLDAYADVSKKLDQMWRFEGNHALLHHLNAMYGYNETIVIERKGMRF